VIKETADLESANRTCDFSKGIARGFEHKPVYQKNTASQRNFETEKLYKKKVCEVGTKKAKLTLTKKTECRAPFLRRLTTPAI